MKILVISLAGNGDTLFATPLIHELRLNFPEAQIEAFVRWPAARAILENNPHLSAVHQKDLISAPKAESCKFLWSLRQRRFDVTINTIPQSRAAYRLVARVIAAPVRLSHRYGHFGWLNPLLVNRTLDQNYSIHCVENNLALLDLIGAKPKLDAHGYEIFPSAAEKKWAEDFIAGQGLAGFKLLGLHVGSGSTKNLALRRWPLAHYEQLLRRLNQAQPGTAVLLFGGPDEEKDHRQLLAGADSKRVFAPPTKNLRQAAALLEKCQSFLSVDTALMHLAAAVKVPRQLVIETPSWNKTVEPFGRPFVLIPNPAVAGKNLEFYSYDGRGIQGTREEILRCMASVSFESVYQAVMKSLD